MHCVIAQSDYSVLHLRLSLSLFYSVASQFCRADVLSVQNAFVQAASDTRNLFIFYSARVFVVFLVSNYCFLPVIYSFNSFGEW